MEMLEAGLTAALLEKSPNTDSIKSWSSDTMTQVGA